MEVAKADGLKIGCYNTFLAIPTCQLAFGLPECRIASPNAIITARLSRRDYHGTIIAMPSVVAHLAIGACRIPIFRNRST